MNMFQGSEQKLHAVARISPYMDIISPYMDIISPYMDTISPYMDIIKRHTIMNAFINSQSGYCPLVAR